MATTSIALGDWGTRGGGYLDAILGSFGDRDIPISAFHHRVSKSPLIDNNPSTVLEKKWGVLEISEAMEGEASPPPSAPPPPEPDANVQIAPSVPKEVDVGEVVFRELPIAGELAGISMQGAYRLTAWFRVREKWIVAPRVEKV
jgi:hypothetical protein